MANHVSTIAELARWTVSPIQPMQSAISVCTPISVMISESIT